MCNTSKTSTRLYFAEMQKMYFGRAEGTKHIQRICELFSEKSRNVWVEREFYLLLSFFFRRTQSLPLTIALKKYILSCKVHIRIVILMFFKSLFFRTIMVHTSLLLIKRFFFTTLAQTEGWEIGYMCYILYKQIL